VESERAWKMESNRAALLLTIWLNVTEDRATVNHSVECFFSQLPGSDAGI